MLTRGTRLISGNDEYSENPPPAFLSAVTDADVLGDFITNYVKTTVGHYKGKIYAWDVVDEAVLDIADPEDENNLIRKDSVFFPVEDYICKAFKAAREADPDALLLLSDYGYESTAGWQKEKSDRVFQVVQNLKAAGCPIGGVAMKIEVDLNYNQTMIDGIKANVDRYFAQQLYVHMTDVEVRCVYDPEAEDSCAGWDMTDK